MENRNAIRDGSSPGDSTQPEVAEAERQVLETEAELDRVCESLIELAGVGKSRIDALKRQAEENSDDPKWKDLLFGDRNYKGELSPDGSPWPAAPYKFVRFPQRHVGRCRGMFEKLNPRHGTTIFEIGVGCGYLAYLCRTVRHCRVRGIDIQLERHLVYRVMKELQGLTDIVTEYKVKAFEPIPFGGSFDYIVSTWTTFNKLWNVDAHVFFLRDCSQHLDEKGVLFLRFNLEGYKDNAAVESFYRSIASYPDPEDDCLAVLDQEALSKV